jgi:hypothetical protein
MADEMPVLLQRAGQDGEMHLPVLVDGHHPYDRRACRLPAILLSVHKHVDHLCVMAPSLCICSGNAGDSAARPQP